MRVLRKYITDNFTVTFLSMFLPLFAIGSVIFSIKLATYTAVIQLSIPEMIKLYIFVLPEILFFTLPLTYFIAATLTLFKLSNENEMIVLFSLGIHPKSILRALLTPSMILTLLLLVNFLFIFPHTKVLYRNFISYKKGEAQFNLSASEFGHSFGDWLLYIGKEDKSGHYKNVLLFNKKKEEEVLIKSEQAEVINDSGILRLKLLNGEGYSYSNDSFTQINFDTMYINDTMNTHQIKYTSPMGYWLATNSGKRTKKRRKKTFITNSLLSMLPLLSLFLVASMGIVHIRHQKARVYLYLFVSIALYYVAAIALQSKLGYYAIPTLIVPWLIITYTIYRKTIVNKF